MGFKKTVAAILIAATAAGSLLCAPSDALVVRDRLYAQKFSAIVKELQNDTETLEAVKKLDNAVVFLSVSDGKKQAKVAEYPASELDTAMVDAYNDVKSSGVNPKWMRLDVVISEKEYTYKNFQKEFNNALAGSFRSGVAFDKKYTSALLETQINSGGILNYSDGTFNWALVNKELARMGKEKLVYVPNKLYVFKTQGYFAENSGFAYRLTNGQYNNTGIREFGTDRASLTELAARSSQYLSSICDATGKFKYGYDPISGKELDDYNILRHAGTVWNLIMQYEMTSDERLVPVIESTLAYLKKFVVYKDSSTAFIEDNTLLNVGGNGLALLAYCNYALTFCSSKYNSLIRALANGILFMQKPDGSYTHTLYRNTFRIAKDYIIVYYDGEASYGLLKAYEVLGTQKYLTAAQKAADCFIDSNYEELNSHWISYMFNELTKYIPEEKYFEFGLKNVMANDYMRKLYKSRSGKNSSNETINAVFELYDRLISGGYKCDYLEEFDEELLFRALNSRAEYGINYFMFPEQAMFFKAPDTVVNSFTVREDSYRLRIDDIQHFMDGYYLYWKNYDRIMQYTENTEQMKTKNKAA